MAVYAPDCGKDLEVYETFVLNVTKVKREGRRGGAREFHITGDLNVELDIYCVQTKKTSRSSEGHLREGRRAGGKELYITSDFNVELGSLCTDEADIGEFHEMYGLLCWQGCERDHSGFKKLMWYGIMKEFNCNVTSTWSKCGLGERNGPHAPTVW